MLCLHETAAGAEVWRPLAGGAGGTARVIALRPPRLGRVRRPGGLPARPRSRSRPRTPPGLMERAGDRERRRSAAPGSARSPRSTCSAAGPTSCAGAVLIEPPLLAFLPEATEGLSADRAAIEAAVRDGGRSRGAWTSTSAGGLPFLGPGAGAAARETAAGGAASTPGQPLRRARRRRRAGRSGRPPCSSAEVPVADRDRRRDAAGLLRRPPRSSTARLGGAELLRLGGDGLAPRRRRAPSWRAAVEALLGPSWARASPPRLASAAASSSGAATSRSGTAARTTITRVEAPLPRAPGRDGLGTAERGEREVAAEGEAVVERLPHQGDARRPRAAGARRAAVAERRAGSRPRW